MTAQEALRQSVRVLAGDDPAVRVHLRAAYGAIGEAASRGAVGVELRYPEICEDPPDGEQREAVCLSLKAEGYEAWFDLGNRGYLTIRWDRPLRQQAPW